MYMSFSHLFRTDNISNLMFQLVILQMHFSKAAHPGSRRTPEKINYQHKNKTELLLHVSAATACLIWGLTPRFVNLLPFKSPALHFFFDLIFITALIVVHFSCAVAQYLPRILQFFIGCLLFSETIWIAPWVGKSFVCETNSRRCSKQGNQCQSFHLR